GGGELVAALAVPDVEDAVTDGGGVGVTAAVDDAPHGRAARRVRGPARAGLYGGGELVVAFAVPDVEFAGVDGGEVGDAVAVEVAADRPAVVAPARADPDGGGELVAALAVPDVEDAVTDGGDVGVTVAVHVA